MTEQNTRLGILLMIATTFVFAMQDGISRHLAGEYNVFMVIMIRYWFFAAFVMSIAARKAGGLRAAAKTSQPILQAFRAVLLVTEICVMVLAFTLLGLIESHAVFTCYPLLIAALSGPVLGEKVGWRRWAAWRRRRRTNWERRWRPFRWWPRSFSAPRPPTATRPRMRP